MTDLHDINTRNREDKVMDFEDWFHKDKVQRFWICWVEGTDGGWHYRHPTLERAKVEAERLARLPDEQGKIVYLFECIGKCRVEQTPVKWEVPR